MSHLSGRSRYVAAGALFAVCVAPTFISYQPYAFRWDDSDYLWQSVAVSQALWAGSGSLVQRLHEVRAVMVGIRPPAMTIMGVPWGALDSWEAAGKCLISLDGLISLVAVACFYLLMRVGVKGAFLAAGCVAVCAALGPWPPPAFQHNDASAFLADSLFAWTCTAALLLIPHESRTKRQGTTRALGRGFIWGLLLSLGTMTKISFLYFASLILPLLLFIRLRREGTRRCGAALLGFAFGFMPAASYLLMFGRQSLQNGGASSFGAVARLYSKPFAQVIRETLEMSPGFYFYFFLLAAGAYLTVQRRKSILWSDVAAILIACGFGLIVVASPNLQIRYAFPSIVSLPLLLCAALSGEAEPTPPRPAGLTAALVLIALIAVVIPVRHRAQRSDSLGRADAVLSQARLCQDSMVLLATDSPTLNGPLVRLASLLTQGSPQIQVSQLVARTELNLPISGDFSLMDQADAVVFQDHVIYPQFSNARSAEYKRYLEGQSDYRRFKVWDDLDFYTRRCGR